MKVIGTGTTSSAGGARRTSRTERRGGEFARHLDALDDPADPAPVEGMTTLSGVDALFAAQLAGDATDDEGRKRLVRRGEDILDKLEQVRIGLLTGTLPKSRLEDLTRMVRSQRDSVADPRLASLLDEIELRAEVELAKLSQD
jgi:hypothetical protein